MILLPLNCALQFYLFITILLFLSLMFLLRDVIIHQCLHKSHILLMIWGPPKICSCSGPVWILGTLFPFNWSLQTSIGQDSESLSMTISNSSSLFYRVIYSPRLINSTVQMNLFWVKLGPVPTWRLVSLLSNRLKISKSRKLTVDANYNCLLLLSQLHNYTIMGPANLAASVLETRPDWVWLEKVTWPIWLE